MILCHLAIHGTVLYAIGITLYMFSGFAVVAWLALSPHSKRVPGSNCIPEKLVALRNITLTLSCHVLGFVFRF